MAGRFRTLTPQAVRQLSPGARLREHGVVVEKLDGDERWLAEFMHHRQRVHRVLGLSSAGWTRTKCEERIEELKAELRQGFSSLPVGRKTQVRFAELAAWYLDAMEETGGKNLVNKRPQIEHRLKPFFGEYVVDGLTEEHVGRYVKSHQRRGLSPSTINRDLATLGHIFTTAVRRKKLLRAPCRIEKLQEPQGRIVVLTDEEIVRLRRAAVADVNPDLWLFVEFGLNTAMRASEMTKARFEHLDVQSRRLYIPDAKAGTRHQPVTPHLIDVLQREREARDDKAGRIFASRSPRSATGRVVAFNKPYRRAVEAAGLDPTTITPHVMRHTAITRLIEAGTPLPTVQQISGHKTIAMVLRYTHVSNPHVDDAMKALSTSLSRGD